MRTELGLSQHDPLAALSLAAYLSIEVITPYDLADLPNSVLKQLTETDPDGWSAVSFSVDEQVTVICNSKKSPGRQSSDIMHELAHVILEHDPSQLILSETGQFAMRSFDAKQEDEANWLGWTLLLPRPALTHCALLSLSTMQIATKYGVSETLVAFRRRMTGIDFQRRRKKTA